MCTAVGACETIGRFLTTHRRNVRKGPIQDTDLGQNIDDDSSKLDGEYCAWWDLNAILCSFSRSSFDSYGS